ncbi:MAG TPA: acyl carrier protein [Defluviitoga tunisiensis]|nr:acyl carrier protein [Defluviitoga tunisiensis]
MEDKILEIASKVFGVSKDNLSIESNRDDIHEWDSLAHLNLIAEMEEQLNITIPFEEIGNIRSLKDFLRYFDEKNND